MNYSKLLMHGYNYAMTDKVIFEKWVTEKIPTETMIRLFRRNNHVSWKIYIEPDRFVEYLATLGYRRAPHVD